MWQYIVKPLNRLGLGIVIYVVTTSASISISIQMPFKQKSLQPVNKLL